MPCAETNMTWLIDFTLLLAVLGTGVRGAASSDWQVQEWDVIVVGAGPAGIIGECILMNNLFDLG